VRVAHGLLFDVGEAGSARLTGLGFGFLDFDFPSPVRRLTSRATQGTLKGRQTGGDFFWLLFLARQEK
jgi:hypothetical protein